MFREAEPIQLTYTDLAALPEDGKRYEIIEGDLYVTPSPVTLHQRIAARLSFILIDHVRRHLLGEVFIAPLDVLLSKHNVIEPDIIFVSNARAGIVKLKNIKGAPDLLVEVLSPATARRDKRDKRAIYARHGVLYYWIIDPTKRRLTELELVEDAYAVASETEGAATLRPLLFPKLRIPLRRLWTA